MKKTEKMIDAFLKMIEKDKVIAADKLDQLKEQCKTLDRERSEISKAVIRMENAGEQEAVNKLTKELSKRMNEIILLDSKIEAYREMGNNYESEAEKIFICAAKEINEDYPKEREKCFEDIFKAKDEVKAAEKVLQQKQRNLEEKNSRLNSVDSNKKNVLEYQLPEIMKYMPDEIKTLKAPIPDSHYETEVVAETTHQKPYTGPKENKPKDEDIHKSTIVSKKLVYDGKVYEEGLGGALQYYYDNGIVGEKDFKKKTLVDKILGR